jgi:hypothetical protein
MSLAPVEVTLPVEPRLPPLILQIPTPPSRNSRLPKIFGVTAAAEFVIGLVLAFVLPWRAGLIVASILLFQAAIFGGLAAWFAHRLRRAHELERESPAPQADDDPLAHWFRGQWRDGMRYPQGRRMREALAAHPPQDPTRARIISLGHVDVPRIGDFHFEPEIVTPTRYTGRNLVIVGLGLFFVALAIVKWTRALPIPALQSLPLNSFGYFYVMLFIVGGAWLYRTTIRPTYIRLAPGVVEIVRFSFRRGPPEIRSYPLTAGTTIVLYAAWWGRGARRAAPPSAVEFEGVAGVPRRPVAATLYRDGRTDYLSFHQMRRSHEMVDRFWQALLSTAPTPPLSRDELVG